MTATSEGKCHVPAIFPPSSSSHAKGIIFKTFKGASKGQGGPEPKIDKTIGVLVSFLLPHRHTDTGVGGTFPSLR